MLMIVEITKVLKNFEEIKFSQLYFVACGGSQVLMQPAKYFLDGVAKSLSSDLFNAGEFLCLNPERLNEEAVVILCSQEGATPETVEAAAFARSRGAHTIALAMKDGTPLQSAAEYFVPYSYYEICEPIETSYGVVFQLAAGLLDLHEGSSYLSKVQTHLKALSTIVSRAKERALGPASEFAEAAKDEKQIYVLGSAGNYSQAYLFSKTYLMEMQWIDSISLLSDEFFHGPFEVVEKDSLIVILRGLGSAQLMDDRAIEFCRKYTDRLHIVDLADYELEGFEQMPLARYFVPMIFNPIMRCYSRAIAEKRKHPLETRRYMHIVDYEWRSPQ